MVNRYPSRGSAGYVRDCLPTYFGESEVSKDGSSPVQEDVGWFEIPVDHSLLSHVAESLPDVNHQPSQFLLGEGPLLFEAVIQAAIAAEHRHNVAVPFREEGLDEVQGVGVPEELQDFDLLENEILQMTALELVEGDGLDGNDLSWMQREVPVSKLIPR